MNLAVMPCDIEAEASLLGALILSGGRLLETVELILAPQDFYRPGNCRIFEAIQDLANRGEPIDLVTLQGFLRDADHLEECGGAPYLYQLTESPAWVANADAYARRVASHAARRRLVEAAYQSIGLAGDMALPLESALAQAEGAILDAAAQQGMAERIPTARQFIPDSLRLIAERRARGGNLVGTPSGLHAWDMALSGLRPGNLVLLAGRPAMGKTAGAVSVALHVAKAGGRVAFFSLEMTRQEISDRLLSAQAQVDSRRVSTGRITDAEVDALDEAARALVEIPLAIDDTPGISPLQVLARARRIRADLGGLDLVIVDYLQKLAPDKTRRGGTREEEVGGIAASLKTTAKTLGVPVLTLAQLNRAVEHRQDKRPVLSDLAESGRVEAESDSVTFLYRPAYYQRPEAVEGNAMPPRPEEREEAEWIVAKNRHGQTGAVKLAFCPAYTRFDNLAEADRW